MKTDSRMSQSDSPRTLLQGLQADFHWEIMSRVELLIEYFLTLVILCKTDRRINHVFDVDRIALFYLTMFFQSTLINLAGLYMIPTRTACGFSTRYNL